MNEKAKAKYPLKEVFKILDSNDRTKIWFSAYTKSIGAVLYAYQNQQSGPKANEEAKIFILQGIRTLSEKDFIKSVIMWGDSNCIADEYGIIFDDRPWYLKFRIDEDGDLDEISFHKPERELKTKDGVVIYGEHSK